MRKLRPSVPHWVWLELDGCWFCENRNNCNQCKLMKQYASKAREEREREDKRKIAKEIREEEY